MDMEKTKRFVSRIVSGLMSIAAAVFFLLIKLSDKSIEMFLLMRCFLPMLCLATAVYMFCCAAAGDKKLYAPDKPLTPKNRRQTEKAYAKHKTEQANRNPMEQELNPEGNIIMNIDKYISGMNTLFLSG